MERRSLQRRRPHSSRRLLPWGRVTWMVLLGLWGGAPASAQEPLSLTEGRTVYPLGPHLAFAEDPAGRWTVEEVANRLPEDRFTPSREAVPQFGYSPSPRWLRFTVRNTEDASDRWMLELYNKSLDHLSFFAPADSGGFVAVHTGDNEPFSRRVVRHRNFVFPLSVPPGAERTYYLRAETKGPARFPTALLSPEAFAQKERVAQFFLGAFFGLLTVMVAYNLLLYVTIRDVSFLVYAVFIGSYLVYQLAVERIGFEYLWPEGTWWNERCTTTFGLLCAAAGTQFSRIFLDTPRFVPRTDRVLVGAMAACVPLLVLNLFVRHSAVNMLIVTFVIALVGLLLAAAVLSLLRNNETARYYLMAWALMLVGVAIGLLSLLGVVPYTFWTTRSAQIGAALGVTLLSLGVGYRYNALRRAREQMRLRIASDLHDDVGSRLTQISLYSELIQRQVEGPPAEWAAHTGELARTLTGEMQDIVWAIRPEEETWEALEMRMKDHAVDLLAPKGIAFEMRGHQEDGAQILAPDIRQNVLLMFKEIIHNAVRHAGCSEVTVDWRLTRRHLWLQVADDGCGFDPDVVRGGNGLKNLFHRAAEINADLVLDTAPGRAVRVEIQVPL